MTKKNHAIPLPKDLLISTLFDNWQQPLVLFQTKFLSTFSYMNFNDLNQNSNDTISYRFC